MEAHITLVRTLQQSLSALFFQHGRIRGPGPLSRGISSDHRDGVIVDVVGGGSAATRAHATRTPASPSSPNCSQCCRSRWRRQLDRQSGAKDSKLYSESIFAGIHVKCDGSKMYFTYLPPKGRLVLSGNVCGLFGALFAIHVADIHLSDAQGISSQHLFIPSEFFEENSFFTSTILLFDLSGQIFYWISFFLSSRPRQTSCARSSRSAPSPTRAPSGSGGASGAVTPSWSRETTTMAGKREEVRPFAHPV